MDSSSLSSIGLTSQLLLSIKRAHAEACAVDSLTRAQMLVKLSEAFMTTIEAKIREPVLKRARELAERENIPLEQIISLAVTQAVGIWSNER